MRNDKEFKAKNREESLAKELKPDIKLGRHGDETEHKPVITQSKKNRMYQARQEQTEMPVDNQAFSADEMAYTDTKLENVSIYGTEQPPQDEQKQYIQEPQNFDFTDNSYQDIPKNDYRFPPNIQGKYQKQMYYTHTEHMADSYGSSYTNAAMEHDLDGTDTYNPKTDDVPDDTPSAGISKERGDYDISEAVQDNKTEFERNSDINFSETAADRDSNIAFDRVHTSNKAAKPDNPKQGKRKQRLYSRDRKQSDASSSDTKAKHSVDGSNKSEQEPSAYMPFDRVKKFEKKADKAKAKSDKAQQKLPHKTKVKKQRLYDEQNQKPKNRLQFEKEIRPQSDLYHRSPLKSGGQAVQYAARNKIHSKITEIENDNTAVEAAHKTEQKTETLAHYSVRTAKYIDGHRKAEPYQKAAKLKYRAEKSEIKAAYEKTLAENPQLKKSALKKFQQKQRIKKQYQKAKRAEQSAKTAKKTAQNTERAIRRFSAFVWRHKMVFSIVLVIALLIIWLGSILSSCSVMLTTGFNSIMVSSYFAEDEDIYAAENYYVSLEQDLQTKINRIESDYPGYDEYKYNMTQIGHNPYELISYLTAVYQDFTYSGIQDELDVLFKEQYHLRITETTEPRTDEDGNTYDYKILNVTLTNSGFTQALNAKQRELYYIYLESKGNRDYLFADDIYANESDGPGYTIPGEALTDETFRRLITEAEKYLGYPYVWGGSTPATSFDCSGFVCWVFQNSGVYPLSRTTAQGIYNQCARISPQDAKPGDIIFFKGTYNTSEVSHVGIYVGDGMMIHCGNPIQYTSVNTNYWQSHFFAYGRLDGN